MLSIAARGHEAQQHRLGHQVGQPSCPQHAEQQPHRADHESQRQAEPDVVQAARGGHGAERRVCQQGGDRDRPGLQVRRRGEDGRHHRWQRACVRSGDRRHPDELGVGERLRDADHRHAHPRRPRRTAWSLPVVSARRDRYAPGARRPRSAHDRQRQWEPGQASPHHGQAVRDLRQGDGGGGAAIAHHHGNAGVTRLAQRGVERDRPSSSVPSSSASSRPPPAPKSAVRSPQPAQASALMFSTTPAIGMRMSLAMRPAREATVCAEGCGVVTASRAACGTSSSRDSVTSPVPGGRSSSSTSSSPSGRR